VRFVGGHRCTRSEEGGLEVQGQVAGVKYNICKFCGRDKDRAQNSLDTQSRPTA
jgi:hypothetical protein